MKIRLINIIITIIGLIGIILLSIISISESSIILPRYIEVTPGKPWKMQKF